MGSDTNELDTREEDKLRKERRMAEEEDIKEMDDTGVMEAIESIIEEWQDCQIDSEEALKQIVTIVEGL
jgi:hypothetical protein